MRKLGRICGTGAVMAAMWFGTPSVRADIDVFVSEVRVTSLDETNAGIRIILGFDFGDVAPTYDMTLAILDDAGGVRSVINIPNIDPQPCDNCPRNCSVRNPDGSSSTGSCYGIIDPPDGRPCRCFVLYYPVEEPFVTIGDGDEGRTLSVVVDWANQINESDEGNNVAEFELSLPCPGDVNGDRIVDLSDIAITLSNFGTSPALLSDGDVTGDGTVDLLDLSTVLSAFGMGC